MPILSQKFKGDIASFFKLVIIVAFLASVVVNFVFYDRWQDARKKAISANSELRDVKAELEKTKKAEQEKEVKKLNEQKEPKNTSLTVTSLGEKSLPREQGRQAISGKILESSKGPAALEKNVPAKKTATVDAEIIFTEKYLSNAIVGNGKGFEHPIKKQLKANPKTFGYTGNQQNREAVAKWAEKEAQVIAVKSGFIETMTGKEIRVKTKGGIVAYRLFKDNDSKNFINIYVKDAPGGFRLIQTIEIAKDLTSAKFRANLESFEYLHQKA